MTTNRLVFTIHSQMGEFNPSTYGGYGRIIYGYLSINDEQNLIGIKEHNNTTEDELINVIFDKELVQKDFSVKADTSSSNLDNDMIDQISELVFGSITINGLKFRCVVETNLYSSIIYISDRTRRVLLSTFSSDIEFLQEV